MNNRVIKAATVFAFTTIVVLSAFVAKAADEVAKPKPAIELGTPFVDNAILQRQMPVPVWGWSKPGAKITVEFTGQKKTAAAGKDGKWLLTLDPLKASAEPAELKRGSRGRCRGIPGKNGTVRKRPYSESARRSPKRKK